MLDGLATVWVRAAYRARVAVLLFALAASVAAGGYAADHLGINTDTADMISPSLPWRQRYIELEEQFPHFRDTLAVVIDAQTPDLADDAARRLSAALSRHPDRFLSVEWTAGHEFFARNALLFLDDAERTRLVSDLVAAQPLLGRLQRDPGLATVAGLLDDSVIAARDAEGPQVPADVVGGFAARVADAVDATLEGRFHRLSWRRLIGDTRDTHGEVTARQVVVVRPVLDYSRLFPADVALARVREEAARLALDPEHGVRVRITGGVAMSEEELRSVSSGAARAAGLALLGVALVLAVGLGSIRMVAVTLLTLLAGLTWTAAFAAFAVGHLNMISVAFAVLYIGLGVDYAVHYGLRYRELLGDGATHARALEDAARDVGGALALCALTTGIGFFAFLPTRFAGVAELGLIAGVGMFVSLATTLTLMPALLSVLSVSRPPGAGRGTSLPLGAAFDRIGSRHGRTVRVSALVVAALCAFAATGARFDDNPLNLRDADGEAVSTYRALVADGEQWSLDLLVNDEAAARALAVRLEALPQVRRVVRLASFVPSDQDTALAQIDELALLLGPDVDAAVGPPSDVAAAGAPLDRLRQTLAGDLPPIDGLDRLKLALERLHGEIVAGDSAHRRRVLAALQDAVTGTLTPELERLSAILAGDRITVDSLPEFLVRDWRAPDGRLRLRVDAADDLNRREALVRFVEAVREVAPDAVGTPIVNLESARVVVGAFAQAFALALACIVVILFLVLRRVGAVLMVLMPLALAALVTVAVMVALQVPFNFANVIALPLLLGVGVDSGIHMLTRARMAQAGTGLAGSGTARGVVTSAVTTAVSFGNLAFSGHPGTASMGVVLSVGMACVLAATLLVMPALAGPCLGRKPGPGAT